MKTDAGRWDELRTIHRQMVLSFVAECESQSEEQWKVPLSNEKWSPAQIADHVRLSYFVLANELAGGKGLRVRTTLWQRFWIRLKFLPDILKSGKIPVATRAPGELRPADLPPAREDLIRQLLAEVDRFETELQRRWSDSGSVVSHHIFGGLSSPQAFQFVTIHTGHHLRQMQKRETNRK